MTEFEHLCLAGFITLCAALVLIPLFDYLFPDKDDDWN